MNKLEEKIKANKLIIEEKMGDKNSAIPKSKNSTKSGFGDAWDKGWGNYGKISKTVDTSF